MIENFIIKYSQQNDEIKNKKGIITITIKLPGYLNSLTRTRSTLELMFSVSGET